MKRIITLSFLGILFSSCSSYVSYLHRTFDQYDREQRENRFRENARWNHQRYGNKGYGHKRNNLNIKKLLSTHTDPKVHPSTKRHYRPEKEARKRYRASDLNDNRNSESLWVNESDKNRVDYLFTHNKKKQNGDIVLIHVYNKLKNEITHELRRAFPALRKKDDKKEKTDTQTNETPVTAELMPSNSRDRVYDKISSIVVDEINMNHLLLKGWKNLLYKNRKRTVEVQALVSRKNISDDDIVKSDDILDVSVQVVRR